MIVRALCIALLGLLVATVAGCVLLATLPEPEFVMVPCRMGWYDPEFIYPHYTMVPVVVPYEDPAHACDAIPPCGQPRRVGAGAPCNRIPEVRP